MPKCIFTNHGSGGGLTLLSISVTTPPNKTNYLAGDIFDANGMVITASYGIHSNVVTEVQITGYSVSPNPLVDGINEVTISYTENGKTCTTTTPVQITHKLQSIEVTTLPDKITYEYSDTLDTTGMVVTATYSDSNTVAITGYSCSPTALTTVTNSQVITVSYTENGINKQTTFNVVVNRKSVAKPTWKNNLTFNGNLQSAASTSMWDNYNTTYMTIGGTTSATNAGTYGATFTLNNNYRWDDETTTAITVNWTIDKIAGSFVLSTTSVSLDASNYSAGIQVTVSNATGAITAVSSNNVAVPVIVNGDIITIKGDGSTAGNFVVTVKCAESTNYIAPADQNITVNAEYFTFPFTDGSVSNADWWDKLKTALATSTLEQRQECLGRKVQTTLTSPVLNTTTHYVRCVGYDCDGDKTLTFQTMNCLEKLTVFVSDDEYKTFDNQVYWTNGTTDSTARKLCKDYYNAFPGKNAILTVNKRYCTTQDNNNIAHDNDATVIYPETVFLPSENEMGWTQENVPYVSDYGTASGKNEFAEMNINNIAYQYYTSDDKRVKYFGTNDDPEGQTSGGTEYWERSRPAHSEYQKFSTCRILDNGKPSAQRYYDEYSLAPAFVIGNPPPKIYGVEWDGTSTTKWTRTDDATLFADPAPAINNGNGNSPFDNLMPWSGMTRVTDSEAGELVAIPKFWYKWTKNGNILKLQIAPEKVEGFYVSPAHADRGDGKGERDMVYVGRYHCASGYKSTTGAAQQVDITRLTARTGIHNLGATIWQFDYAMRVTIQMLYLVEYADWNSQEKIGYGCSAGGSKENNGKTDGMGYHTGTTAASRTTYGYTQYRNIEGLWDNVFDWMDGCYYNENGMNITMNPANFSNSSGGTLIGKPSSGYPSAIAVATASGLEWAIYPTAASGSDSTYVADYWYYSGSSPCLCCGGNYSRGQYLGLFYVVYYNASSSYSNVGCRLQKLP